MISEYFFYLITPQIQDIREIVMHLENQRKTILHFQLETPLIFKLSHGYDFLQNNAFKQIDAVFSGAMKGVGERETTNTWGQISPDEKRTLRIIQLNNQLIFILAEA
jgi:hypothetical protein